MALAVAEVALDAARVRTFSAPCDCTGDRCLTVPAARIHGRTWSRCPWPEVRSAWWSAVLRIDRLASISPLAGWPDQWSAGLADCILALRDARAEWQAAQFEAVTDG